MARIRVGNAPCSWGSLEFDGLDAEPIGHTQMLDELVETGYAGTELGDWGYMPTGPDELRAELRARGLTMLGAFVPVALANADAHEPGAGEALKIARLLAAVRDASGEAYDPYLVLADDNGAVPERTRNAGRVTSDMMLEAREARILADGARHIAETVREATGLRTVFHHHCAGYVETPDEIARLLEQTGPDTLGLVFDTGHYAFGSGENSPETVLDGFDAFADRIWYVHFKDCAPAVARQSREQGWDYFESVKQGVFCELGCGMVDFPALLEKLRGRGYDGWICVEQDVLPGMGAPKESAWRNREYLRSIGLNGD